MPSCRPDRRDNAWGSQISSGHGRSDHLRVGGRRLLWHAGRIVDQSRPDRASNRRRRADPPLAAGTRARTVAVYVDDEFLQRDRWVEAEVVGASPKRRVRVVAPWVKLPPNPPWWLNLDTPLPSAAAADVATLAAALVAQIDGGANASVATFAAIELTRRATDPGSLDRQESLDAIAAAIRSTSPLPIANVLDGIGALPRDADRVALGRSLEPAITVLEQFVYRPGARSNDGYQADALRRELGLPSLTHLPQSVTRPATGA